jgi:protein ImuA
MAGNATAREAVCALRRDIARIEGRLAETLDAPSDSAGEQAVLRRNGRVVPGHGMLATGVERLDDALGGGIPRAALTEIHSAATRDAGAAAGLALALVGRLLVSDPAPVLWIGTSEIFREAGFPYALGIHALCGIDPERFLVAQAAKLADTLWIAEEAARLHRLSAILLETRGNPASLDLTATRRLHRRAQESARLVILLREAAVPEPTAAPVRLIVSPAPSGLRHALDGPLAGSIGPPAFTLTVSKNRNAPPAQFTLEWNSHERSFQERRTQNTVPVVSAPQHRAHLAAETGARVAFRRAAEPASGDQPSREQYPAHRRLG